MAADNSRPPRRPESLGEAAQEVGDAARQYLRARTDLLKLEAREASRWLTLRGAALVAGVLFLVVAYLLIVVGIIGLAEHFRQGSWAVATLVVAAIHLIGGLALLHHVRRRPPRPFFEESLKQWRQDEQWLSRKDRRKEGPRARN